MSVRKLMAAAALGGGVALAPMAASAADFTEQTLSQALPSAGTCFSKSSACERRSVQPKGEILPLSLVGFVFQLCFVGVGCFSI